ncbi:unnamed protein product [Parajaminaea phylloscopi]
MPFTTKRQLMQQQRAREGRAEVQSRKTAHVLKHPASFLDPADRTNLVCQDGDETIWRRISPTSLRQESYMKADIAAGEQLLDTLRDTATAEGAIHVHHGVEAIYLGMWYNVGRALGWTKAHTDCQPASDRFFEWIMEFFKRYIACCLGLFKEDFQEELQSRGPGMDWLKGEVKTGNVDALHHWWALATVFTGYATGEHQDKNDHEPSILINFQQSTIFTIDGSHILLHPGDFLVFRNKLTHSARPWDSTQPVDRWAIGFTMRTHIVEAREFEKRHAREREGSPLASSSRRVRSAQLP